MLAVALGSAGAAAAAEIDPLRIDVVAPASCPPRPTLFERIRRHTARVREPAPNETSRALRVVITAEAERFDGELSLVEGGEALERRVAGATCEEVLAAVALITALTIDPLAGSAPAQGGDPVAEPSLPTPSRAPSAPEAGAGRPSRSHAITGTSLGAKERPSGARMRLHASVGASLEAYGLGEAVIARGIWVEAALGAAVSPALRIGLSRTQSFTIESDMRPAFFTLTTAAADGCAALLRWGRADAGRDRFVIRPCAQLAAGVLQASSGAFGAVHRIPRPWVSMGATLQARLWLAGPLALESGAGLTAPLVRDDFYFLPGTHVYRPPSVMLVGSVGVGAAFR